SDYRGPPTAGVDDDAPGSALPVTGTPKPDAIEATFDQRSYSAGQSARLRVVTRASGLGLSVLRAGYGSDGVLQGAPVADKVQLVSAESATVRIGDWQSGLYYVRLAAPGGRLGYAPFVVRPRRLGEHKIAVVLPTNTWQAYNFYDADGDGKPDSWYPNPHVSCVDLSRPFLDRGVPPHYTAHARGFIRWLARTG